jgi:hypothetical protein
LERDAEHSHLALDAADEDPMDQLLGHSITYRIAVGPQQGRKVFTFKPCLLAMPTTCSPIPWVGRPGSRCMSARLSMPGNGTSWSG